MRTLVLGTAGHIDHGKSALVEALTGVHPDRLKEEQARGITIELGFGHTRIGDLSVALVDVPGHERFVRTMLAGAGGLDAVLLVIAADESVMPQTREHLDICRLLGVRRGLIVLTKADLVDADGLALAELEARELVAGSMLAEAPVIATSARTGAGLDKLRAAIAALAGTAAVPRAGRARLPIDRVFSVKGFGTVVTGTLVSGAMAIDQTMEVVPAARTVRVRGLQVHGEAVSSTSAPRRVAVNLAGVDVQDVARGMTLCAPGSLPLTRRLDAHLTLLPHSPALRHGARVRVHQGTTDALARVSISAVRVSGESAWGAVSPGESDVSVPPGGEALVRLRVARALAATRGDRFVIRLPAPAGTVGGGTVIDPEPPRGGVRRAGASARLAALAAADLDALVETWTTEAGVAGVSTAALARRAGVADAQVAGAVAALSAAGRVCVVHDRVCASAVLARAAAALTQTLTTFHRAHPDEAGLPREEARGAVPAEVFAEILTRAGIANAERLALPGHRPAVSGEEAAAAARVEAALRAAGLQPPDANTLAASSGLTPAVVTRVVFALTKAGRLMKLGDLWFHREALDALKREVAALGSGATLDVAAAKARWGLSRKFAIPLLEHLDRERVTRRVGDRRVVL